MPTSRRVASLDSVIHRERASLARGLLLTLAVLGGVPTLAGAACVTTICTPDPLDPSKCTISTTNTVDNGCVLDFGARFVTVSRPGKLQTVAQGQSFTVRAAQLTLSGTMQAQGGTLTIVTTGGSGGDGGFRTNQVGNGPGKIDVRYGGTVQVTAAGVVDLQGQQVTADGGSAHRGGGIKMTGTSVTVGCPLDADGSSGGDGGIIQLVGSGNVSINGLTTANGEGPINGATPAFGGTIVVRAGGTLAISKNLQAKGDQDGDGGRISLTAVGTATLDGNYNVSGIGNGNEGAGGRIAITAASLTITGGWSANGNGGSEGGDVDVAASTGTLSMTTASSITANSGGSGGGSAGTVSVFGAGNVTVSGGITAKAGGDGSEGGEIAVESGGNLTVSSTLEAISTTNNGSHDGTIRLRGACGVQLSGALKSRNLYDQVGSGGNVVEYGGSLTTTGATMSADDGDGNTILCACIDTAPTDGVCDAPAQCAQAPSLSGATINPAADVVPVAHPTCS